MVIKKQSNKTFFENKYGYGQITVLEEFIEISIMRVELKYRDQGYGKKLMRYLLNHIQIHYPIGKRIILSPLPLDEEGLKLKDLIGFYKKFRFRESDIHPKDKPYMMELILS